MCEVSSSTDLRHRRFLLTSMPSYTIQYTLLLLLLCSNYCHCCPTACSCEYPGIVYCAGMQLREIPKDVPRGTQALILGSNLIHFVGLNSFLEVRSLIELHLDRNLIGFIPSRAFHPLKNLKFLDLRHNKVKEISRMAFSGLMNLNRLNLAGNLISVIDAQSLSFVPKLETLNLYDNPLRELPDGIFRRSAAVTSLNLGKCDIQSLTTSTFRGLRNLSTLVLGENKNLDALQNHVFAGLRRLEKLTLNHGGLKRITSEAFSGLDRLKEILLDHNRLAHTLALNIFKDNPHIEVLRLDGNQLSSLHYNVVSSLKHLKMLHLDDNRWRCDCGLLGVRAFWSLGKPPILTSPGIRCTYPEKYRDLNLWNIPVRSLVDSCLRNIEVTTTSISVDIGSRIDLDCSLSAQKDAYLAWFSSRTVYMPNTVNKSNNSRFFIQENGALTIDPVTKTDLGPFICSVTYPDGATALRAVVLISESDGGTTGDMASSLLTYVVVIITFTILALLILLLLLVVVLQRKYRKEDRRPLSHNPFTFLTLGRQTNLDGEYAYAYADMPKHNGYPMEIDAYAISGNLSGESIKNGVLSSTETCISPQYGSLVFGESITREQLPKPNEEAAITDCASGCDGESAVEGVTTVESGTTGYSYVSPNQIQLEKMRQKEQEKNDEDELEVVEEDINDQDHTCNESGNRASSGYIEILD